METKHLCAMIHIGKKVTPVSSNMFKSFSHLLTDHSKAVLLSSIFICYLFHVFLILPKIVSEYDQEIPQLQNADKAMAPQGRTTSQSQDTKKTN